MRNLLFLFAATIVVVVGCIAEKPQEKTKRERVSDVLKVRNVDGGGINSKYTLDSDNPAVGQTGLITSSYNDRKEEQTFDLTGLNIKDSKEIEFSLNFYENAQNAHAKQFRLNGVDKDIKIGNPIWIGSWEDVNGEIIDTKDIPLGAIDNSLKPVIADNLNDDTDFIFHSDKIGYVMGSITYTNGATATTTTLKFEGPITDIGAIEISVTAVE